MDAVKFWRGGLVFYGGLIFAFLTGLWYVRRHRLDFRQLADLIAPSIALGQAMGRLGCFAAGCCYGAPSTAPWACTFTSKDSLAPLGVPLHPTQIYESAATFGIFIALLIMRKSKRFAGQLFWYYLLFYSVARFIIEFYRGDPRGWAIPGVLSIAQAIGIPAVLLALFMLLRRKK
jgi:phosphatidylglycerol:prolipoprotein diacylglycerol transferase